MEDTRYFSRAWGLLTRDKGWIKPVLVMTAANLVPVAGPLGNRGYAMEWARLTAWGVDAAPKQKDVAVGVCIKSGWRTFLVELGWGFVLSMAVGFVSVVAQAFPGWLGDFLSFAVSVATVPVAACWGAAMAVSQICASLYGSVAAGYQPNKVYDLVRRDTRGFGKVVLVNLGASVVITALATVLGVLIVLEISPAVVLAATLARPLEVATTITASFGIVAVTCAIFGSAVSLVSVAARLLTTQCAALWLRQFDVSSWGHIPEPLRPLA